MPKCGTEMDSWRREGTRCRIDQFLRCWFLCRWSVLIDGSKVCRAQGKLRVLRNPSVGRRSRIERPTTALRFRCLHAMVLANFNHAEMKPKLISVRPTVPVLILTPTGPLVGIVNLMGPTPCLIAAYLAEQSPLHWWRYSIWAPQPLGSRRRVGSRTQGQRLWSPPCRGVPSTGGPGRLCGREPHLGEDLVL